MVRNVLAAIAAAALLSVALAAYQAAAMPPGGAAAIEDAASEGSLIQNVANVCGMNGCVVVQTKRVQHHQFPKSTAPSHSGS